MLQYKPVVQKLIDTLVKQVQDVIAQTDSDLPFHIQENIYGIYTKILRDRKNFHDADLDSGSGRATFIFQKQGFVIKLPINDTGYRQNLVEFSHRTDDETTNIYQTYELFNMPHFIIVAEYCQPVIEYASDFISDLADKKPHNIDWKTYLTDTLQLSYIDRILALAFSQFVFDFDEYDNDYFDKLDETVEYNEEFEDYTIQPMIDCMNMPIIDENFFNFGIRNHKLVLIDSGIDDRDEFHDQKSDHVLTLGII